MKQHPSNHRNVFLQGMKDGVPIGLGYLAVSFALGISARNAGITAPQGFLMSLLGLASAGEYAAITVIGAGAPYLEMVFVTLVANARYLLMSFALSQRLSPRTGIGHRLLLGYGITDELFGIAIHQPWPLNPLYSYGACLVAAPLWSIGTTGGIIAGNILPDWAVSALSVALYGMFLAIIIPPARAEKSVGLIVAASFAASWLTDTLPYLRSLSGGTRVILLTLLLAGLAAVIFPVEEDGKEPSDAS